VKAEKLEADPNAVEEPEAAGHHSAASREAGDERDPPMLAAPKLERPEAARASDVDRLVARGRPPGRSRLDPGRDLDLGDA
jgi:hypothetical protein